MNKYCRNTPSTIEIKLRQESNFGCALCGCPILENAHIIPLVKSHDFPLEDMVALCPTCHTKADYGHFPEYVLRDAKKNPHNKRVVSDEFVVTGNDLIVNMGGYKAINITRVLVVNDFDIVSINRKHGNYLSLI
ncbi:MAG: HNH endonuclease [Thermoproteota archaeon]|nr:HNH endonuclease [Thermoproteota archaeon]